jgi:hypothetical protein
MSITRNQPAKYLLAKVSAIFIFIALFLGIALPARADARPTVGVGDNSASMFLDQNFQALNTSIARKVVPYDFYLSEPERNQLDQWIANAAALGIRPLIALEHSKAHPRKLPSVGSYRRSISYLRSHYPAIRSISPWNEANHKSQPTAHHPARAAQYYNVVRQKCRGCKIVAADVLDQKNMVGWLNAFKKAAGGKPRIWGLHSYADSNRAVSWSRSSTKTLLRVVKGKVWLTEVGGIVAFYPNFRYNEGRAARAVKRTLAMSLKSSRIQRVYLYSWYGTPRSSHSSRGRSGWDSGLTSAEGVPRAGYRVMKAWMKRYG